MASFLVACSNQCGTILRSMVPEPVSLTCEQCMLAEPEPRVAKPKKPQPVFKKRR